MKYEVIEDRPLSSIAEDDDELVPLLAIQDGVIGRRQALELMTEKSLRHRVASGRWRHAYRGVLVAHSGPISDAQRLWIAVLAVGRGIPTHLGGLSALIVAGLRNIRSDAIHVLVPASRRVRPPAGVIVHRTGHFPSEHRSRITRPPTTVPARSVVDAVQWARSDAEARLIVASAFQQRLVGLPDIDRVLAGMPNAWRRQLILRTAWDCAGGSESLRELDFLALCRHAGLPVPTRHVERRDRSGRRRYLDIYFDEWKLVVENPGRTT